MDYCITRFDFESYFPEVSLPADMAGEWRHSDRGEVLHTQPLACGCVLESYHAHGSTDWLGAIACGCDGCGDRMHGLPGHDLILLCERHH